MDVWHFQTCIYLGYVDPRALLSFFTLSLILMSCLSFPSSLSHLFSFLPPFTTHWVYLGLPEWNVIYDHLTCGCTTEENASPISSGINFVYIVREGWSFLALWSVPPVLPTSHSWHNVDQPYVQLLRVWECNSLAVEMAQRIKGFCANMRSRG